MAIRAPDGANKVTNDPNDKAIIFCISPQIVPQTSAISESKSLQYSKTKPPHPSPKQQLVEASRKVFGSVLTSTISAISAVDLFAVTQIAGFLHFEFTL